MHKVRINPNGIEFDVQDNETILEAAERNGVNFPYRCRQGVCTSCVCKTVSGDVNYGDRNTDSLLSVTDNEQKFTYACIAYAETDLVLHHPFIK